MSKKKICLVPKCGNKVRARGLCPSHYAYTQYLVAEGKTSWVDLVAEGKALGTNANGKRGEFTKWLLGKGA
jgi:hypothetical protein